MHLKFQNLDPDSQVVALSLNYLDVDKDVLSQLRYTRSYKKCRLDSTNPPQRLTLSSLKKGPQIIHLQRFNRNQFAGYIL